MFGLVIPLLLGIAVDLFVFMPIRSFNSETGLVIYVSQVRKAGKFSRGSRNLHIVLQQNWSFGVAYTSIIHNLIHVLPANNSIRQKLNQLIFENGIMQTDLREITHTMIVPVILAVILAITLPGIVSWGILQMLGKLRKKGLLLNRA
jgi:hypothetical protein